LNLASAQSDNPMPLRFTIRDLLWLTLVVAMVVGWWLSYSHSRSQLLSMQESMESWRSRARNREAELDRYILAHGGTLSNPDDEKEELVPAK
jgi:hypothetical protein